jgi:hypothetical protein
MYVLETILSFFLFYATQLFLDEFNRLCECLCEIEIRNENINSKEKCESANFPSISSFTDDFHKSEKFWMLYRFF